MFTHLAPAGRALHDQPSPWAVRGSLVVAGANPDKVVRLYHCVFDAFRHGAAADKGWTLLHWIAKGCEVRMSALPERIGKRHTSR